MPGKTILPEAGFRHHPKIMMIEKVKMWVHRCGVWEILSLKHEVNWSGRICRYDWCRSPPRRRNVRDPWTLAMIIQFGHHCMWVNFTIHMSLKPRAYLSCYIFGKFQFSVYIVTSGEIFPWILYRFLDACHFDDWPYRKDWKTVTAETASAVRALPGECAEASQRYGWRCTIPGR